MFAHRCQGALCKVEIVPTLLALVDGLVAILDLRLQVSDTGHSFEVTIEQGCIISQWQIYTCLLGVPVTRATTVGSYSKKSKFRFHYINVDTQLYRYIHLCGGREP